jgi:hypothetical protein
MNNEEISNLVQINYDELQKIIKSAIQEKEIKTKLDLLKSAAFKALSCKILNSKNIEEELLKIAQNQFVGLSENYVDNSFLHIFTQAYKTGGHTRVAERWIKNSPNSQKHSVLITNQRKEAIPEILQQLVNEKGGGFYIQNQIDDIDKSLELRKIASQYQTIILHIHMDDIIPILAFGTKDFKRPIIFFNHADHEFWLGVSISDLVVNFRSWASNLNRERRGIDNNCVLPLPINEVDLQKKDFIEISKIKKELGFEANSLVIITMASRYKYKSFDGYNFIETIKQILDKVPNAVLLAIGPSENEGIWKEASRTANGRIRAIGLVPNQYVAKYLQIANLAIDSFPFGSFTALLDIAKYNIECLTIKTPINELDSFLEAKILCGNQQELVDRSCEILQNPINQKETNLYKVLKQKHFQSGFYKNLQVIYEKLPISHELRDVYQDQNGLLSEFDFFRIKMKQFNGSAFKRKKLINKLQNFIKRISNKL